MFKRLILALAFVASLIAPVHAAGTISLSLTQQIDKDTLKPLSGGKLYLFAAGTTTPQNAYRDAALTIPLPNPITLDAAGRLPQMFFADGSIKFILANKSGVTQLAADGILVIGPSSGGGGGGGSVDATTIFQTGDVLWLDADTVRTGWVRDNGRTIGSVSSGASERANADTQALFSFIWNTYSDTICPVVGGRGASAAVDWTANKQITLPDKRGFLAGGLDTMGNSGSARYTNVPVIRGNSTLPGSWLGQNSLVLAPAQLPPHQHLVDGDTGTESAQHNHNVPTAGGPANYQTGSGAPSASGGSTFSGNENQTHTHHLSFNSGAGPGTSTPVATVPYTVLGTFYRKL